MKRLIKNIMVLVMLCGLQYGLYSQVTSVGFNLNYNSTTCLYDVRAVILGGSATLPTQRNAGAVTITIVVPAGTTFNDVEVRNWPRDRATQTIPNDWQVASTYIPSPSITPDVDYITTTLNLSPASRYGVLNTNDTIVLFSFAINTTSCGTGIRMWNNATDPSSSDPGMGGSDLDNSFTIGDATERYSGNIVTNVRPPSPTITSITPSCTAMDLNIDLTPVAGACGGTMTYSWIGPGYTGTTQDVHIAGATPDNAGTYEVRVTNQNGCTVTGSVVMTDINCLVLPITLSSFEVKEEGCRNLLAWTTSSEQNNEYFYIERSEDGKNYRVIAQVKGAGNSNTTKRYSYTDTQSPEGISYYRLKQSDYNGASTYSVTRVSVIRCQELTERPLVITPNPSNGLFTVYTPKAIGSYTVTDASGKAVAYRTGISEGSDVLDLQHLPQSLYFLTYKTETKTITEKLVIIR